MRIIVQCDLHISSIAQSATHLGLNPIISPIPELVILQRSTYYRTVQHMSRDRWIISDVTNVVSARCRRRVWVLRRIWVHTHHVDRLIVSCARNGSVPFIGLLPIT
jgi:hypothetical protein